MPTSTARKVALLWRGDRAARDSATLEGNRLRGVAEALKNVGVAAEPAVYDDGFSDEVRDQLLKVDGVLVWVNPLDQGRDRSVLDALLEDVASRGVMVSAHPEVIRKMGTKEVLYTTRNLSWGCDTHLYASAEAFREAFPERLAEGTPRVLKQYRGNGGNGVWKVELAAGTDGLPHAGTPVRARHALRGSVEQTLPLGAFIDACLPYFAGNGRIIDQAWQARLSDGMVRAYLVRDKVAGFGHQLVNALYPTAPGMPASEAPVPGPRVYYPPTKAEFQALKRKMENEWVGALCETLGIDREALPVLWDADFLYGERTASGEDTYVLCEINVSSVHPFPVEALAPLARETAARLR